MSPERTTHGRLRRDRWVWISILPLGLGSWVPIVAGLRYRRRWWVAIGVCWLAVTVVGLTLSGGHRSGGNAGGALLLLSWVGGIATSFGIRHLARRDRALGIADSSSAAASVAPAAQRDRWPWVSLVPFGFGSWAPMIAGARCRVWWWSAAGVAGGAATIGGIVLTAAASSPAGTNQTEAGIGGLLFIGSWIWGIAISFAIRPSYDERRGWPSRRPVWPRPSARSLEWSARYALIAYAVTFGAVIALDLIMRYLVGVHVQVGVGVLLVDGILLASLVPLARTRGLSLPDLGLRPTLALRSLWLVVLALLAYLTIGILWAVAFVGRSARHEANVLSQVHHLGTVSVVVTVFAVSLSAPIVEEIFFRGLLYRSLRNRLPIPQAALLAGLAFGLVHITGYPLVTLPIKAAFGVLACLLYERTGSLLPGIALHSFVDASGADISLSGNDYAVLIVAGSLAVLLLARAAIKRATGQPSAPIDLTPPATPARGGPPSLG